MHKNEGTCAEIIPPINIIGNRQFSAKLHNTQPIICIWINFIVFYVSSFNKGRWRNAIIKRSLAHSELKIASIIIN